MSIAINRVMITVICSDFYIPFNSSHATGHFLYPLGTLEKQRLSDVCRGKEKDQRHEMG